MIGRQTRGTESCSASMSRVSSLMQSQATIEKSRLRVCNLFSQILIASRAIIELL